MNTIQTLSKHTAHERMQQRGVSSALLELLDQFGETEYGHGKALHLYLTRRSIERMYRAGIAKHLIQQAETHKNLRVVVACDNGNAITVKYARRNKRAFKH